MYPLPGVRENPLIPPGWGRGVREKKGVLEVHKRLPILPSTLKTAECGNRQNKKPDSKRTVLLEKSAIGLP